jgi:hypothetical protein
VIRRPNENNMYFTSGHGMARFGALRKVRTIKVKIVHPTGRFAKLEDSE